MSFQWNQNSHQNEIKKFGFFQDHVYTNINPIFHWASAKVDGCLTPDLRKNDFVLVLQHLCEDQRAMSNSIEIKSKSTIASPLSSLNSKGLMCWF